MEVIIMNIFKRDDRSYETDGIDDICCKKFKEAYKYEDIVAKRYDEEIVFRCWNLMLDEYNEYILKYCPFCGKEIKR